ncbi:hypothetical protein AL755_16210 [Arthrobacter sp. ERGS1:01]|uniref:hypothetical protein n=1 Tax=Arthrobacter sp. ERGS1:01 TaxID=1704044 RepID=UPI0006CB06CE|nr:hypothetical protein [Arthrobacter sp. ERGS1:01]ALE06646.1 hypothetical protein AL755_16210 [Arthrobacter sp. ERGS1:01]
MPSSNAEMPHAPPADNGERGSAIVEFVFLAVLLMIPVAYLILTVGQVQGGAYAVVGAADQAAKVYVREPDEAAARQAAGDAVAMAITDMGFDADAATLTISCDGGCLTPGTVVRASVTLKVPLPFVAAIPGMNLDATTVESSAIQKVGRFK